MHETNCKRTSAALLSAPRTSAQQAQRGRGQGQVLSIYTVCRRRKATPGALNDGRPLDRSHRVQQLEDMAGSGLKHWGGGIDPDLCLLNVLLRRLQSIGPQVLPSFFCLVGPNWHLMAPYYCFHSTRVNTIPVFDGISFNEQYCCSKIHFLRLKTQFVTLSVGMRGSDLTIGTTMTFDNPRSEDTTNSLDSPYP